MKTRLMTLALSGLLLLLSTGCGDDGGSDPAPLTTAQKIARTWKTTEVSVNGSVNTVDDYSGFRISFTATADGAPNTYSITVGNAPATPNFNAPNNGSWSFVSGETAIQLGSDNQVNIIGTPTESSLTLEWVDTVDKSSPQYRFVLVP